MHNVQDYGVLHNNSKAVTKGQSGSHALDSIPPTMQSQIPKSRDVTLFFFRHDALQVSGHTLFTSTPHVFLLNIFRQLFLIFK
jgi:hypothetical protein